MWKGMGWLDYIYRHSLWFSMNVLFTPWYCSNNCMQCISGVVLAYPILMIYSDRCFSGNPSPFSGWDLSTSPIRNVLPHMVWGGHCPTGLDICLPPAGGYWSVHVWQGKWFCFVCFYFFSLFIVTFFLVSAIACYRGLCCFVHFYCKIPIKSYLPKTNLNLKCRTNTQITSGYCSTWCHQECGLCFVKKVLLGLQEQLAHNVSNTSENQKQETGSTDSLPSCLCFSLCVRKLRLHWDGWELLLFFRHCLFIWMWQHNPSNHAY